MAVTGAWAMAYTELRVLALEPGETYRLECGDHEWIVLPLAGACAVRSLGPAPDDPGQLFDLRGRAGVFAGVTDCAYLPRDGSARITSPAGGRFALAGALATRRLTARHGPAERVPVELRGAGSCSRQVNNFAAAGVFACDRLIAVEVLTPGGNWSSYPPHKHDEHHPGTESELEEIYYYEIAPHGAAPGVGYQRVSPSPAGKTDILTEVRSGDAVLIPDGWHGPSMAAPGHDMYYLNVMAGPGESREWLIRDHPDHGWIRDTWPDQAVDPRLPFPAADRSTAADRSDTPGRPVTAHRSEEVR